MSSGCGSELMVVAALTVQGGVVKNEMKGGSPYQTKLSRPPPLTCFFKRRQVASILRSVGLSVGLLVGLQNEIYLDETHGSKHLYEKCLL